MAYSSHLTALVGTELWQRPPTGDPARTLVLPDGCMDLIWDGSRLFVAGPDRGARWADTAPDSSYAALRFAGGTGPAVLGVAADEITDRLPPLDELWPGDRARRLTEQVAADPAGTLAALATRWAADVEVDPFGPRLVAMAGAGWSVAAMADRLGTTVRQVHRRSLVTVGYGPRRLARILRFGRAMARVTSGASWAEIAAASGYADQAHLAREVRELTGTTPTRLSATLGSVHPAHRPA